jgi:hypothetical protein
MRSQVLRWSLPLLLPLVLAGCGAEDGDGPVDPVVAEETELESPADRADIPLTLIRGFTLPSGIGETETRRLFKSASSFRSYFGASLSGVDFSRRWVAFYSAGVQRTGGYAASVTRVRLTDSGATLKITTRLDSPGAGCLVTQALSKPWVLVSFPRPSPLPSYTRYSRADTARSCAAPQPTAATFVQDLRNHLVGYYARMGADIADAGGNNLAAAQAAVRESLVRRLTDPEEDPDANDFSRTIVFRHPDVVHPGSDIAWFGAYDKATGALRNIYDFN